MIRVLNVALIFVAVEAAYAFCAAIITETNPYPAMAVLVCALAALAALHWWEHRRDVRLAMGRSAAWARRHRETGGAS